MAWTRSLLRILVVPETPNSDASAWSCGSFMALSAALLSAATVVVSVTLVFPPSHEPWWLQKCEYFHVGRPGRTSSPAGARFVDCCLPGRYAPSGIST